jgi:hypothetical protein
VKKCNWALIGVYGAAHEENKNEFLIELASFCHGILMPYIVGGDFNILRHSGEKKQDFYTYSFFRFIQLDYSYYWA